MLQEPSANEVLPTLRSPSAEPRENTLGMTIIPIQAERDYQRQGRDGGFRTFSTANRKTPGEHMVSGK